MASESGNPFQSPAAVDEPQDRVETPALLSAAGRAAGLGLLGAGAFATPILCVAIIFRGGNWNAIELALRFSVALGVAFAASEILRVGPSERQGETATRVAWSGGLLVVSFFGVMLFHLYVLPGWFLRVTQHFSPTADFWFIAIQTLVVYLILLWVGRQVAKWWIQSRPESLAAESSPEVTDGD